jgi:hypothetical protein
MPSMSSQKSDMPDYQWLEEWVLDEEKLAGVIGVTVTRIDSPERFLALVGAQPPFQTVRGVFDLSRESPPGRSLVGVAPALDKDGRAIEGTFFGAECPGIMSYDSAARLSERGGEVLAFHYNMGQDWLKWAVDGVVQTEFSLWIGTDTMYDGTEKGPAEMIRRAGVTILDPDNRTDDPCAAAATLMTAMFGVVITPKLLDETVFDGGAVKVPY